jgi:hypothetical protein
MVSKRMSAPPAGLIDEKTHLVLMSRAQLELGLTSV